jgi:hypothetical protein
VGRLKLDDANYWYQERAFAIAGTAGTFGNTEVGGFATVTASLGNPSGEQSGSIWLDLGEDSTEVTLFARRTTSWDGGELTVIPDGSSFHASEEFFTVLSLERTRNLGDLGGGTSGIGLVYKVRRGAFDTISDVYSGTFPTKRAITQPNATLFNIGASYGLHFKWY